MGIGKKTIQKYFENVQHGASVKAKQAARDMGVKHEDYPAFKQVLRELADEGVLALVRKNSYAPWVAIAYRDISSVTQCHPLPSKPW